MGSKGGRQNKRKHQGNECIQYIKQVKCHGEIGKEESHRGAHYTSRSPKEVRERALKKSGEKHFRHREHTAGGPEEEMGLVCSQYSREASSCCGANEKW